MKEKSLLKNAPSSKSGLFLVPKDRGRRLVELTNFPFEINGLEKGDFTSTELSLLRKD